MADPAPNPNTPDPNAAPAGDDTEQNVDFPMPEGFEPPKGTKPGAEFEALATLKIDEDGDLCLLKLDGCEVKPEAEEPEPAEPGAGDQTGGPSAIDSMKAALPATGLPGGMA